MKTALLHYWLVRKRGGEKVLSELLRLLPEADVFTHAFRLAREPPFANVRVLESRIGRMPFARTHPEWYLPLMPAASRHLDLSAYELIVSSESGPIKGVRKRPDQRHVCYCHTPMRYVWDLYDDYYVAATTIQRTMMQIFRKPLLRADQESAASVDEFVANSRFVADRIKRTYGRDSTVVYPPVDVDFFSAPCTVPESADLGRPYYLFVGASTSYKRMDLACAACRKMGRRLVVAGNGRRTDAELRALYAGAEALLFPGIEDFGMVPVEAQAAGTPVVAFGRGGALETVREGVTGLFFHEQTVTALCEAIEEFEGRKWNPSACRENARQFGRDRFAREMKAVLERPDPIPNRMASDLRILVATHKSYRMPEGEAFVPLQVGASGKPDLGYVRDDTGDNISGRNANYCELTGLYWAWRNLRCGHLGLVHYRRHFAGDCAGIRQLLRTVGVILPTPRKYVIETNYSQYVHAHHAQDLDVTRQIVAERCSDYLAAFDRVMKRRGGHRFNMFVMRKDFADAYCTWLFDVLFELEKRLDISTYSAYDARVFGFVSERLLDVWLETNRIAWRELPLRNLESQHWPRKLLAFLCRKFVRRTNFCTQHNSGTI